MCGVKSKINGNASLQRSAMQLKLVTWDKTLSWPLPSPFLSRVCKHRSCPFPPHYTCTRPRRSTGAHGPMGVWTPVQGIMAPLQRRRPCKTRPRVQRKWLATCFSAFVTWTALTSALKYAVPLDKLLEKALFNQYWNWNGHLNRSASFQVWWNRCKREEDKQEVTAENAISSCGFIEVWWK